MSDMTTSPVPSPETHREIEEVFGDQIPAPSPSSAREEWRRYAAFRKRPSLVPMDQSDNGVRAVLRMLGLDLMIMLVLLGVIGAAIAVGFDLPNNVNQELEPELIKIVSVVVLAPLAEELLFRGWLSGRPCDVFAFPLAGIAAFMVAGALLVPNGGVALAIFGAVIALPAAAVWVLLRDLSHYQFFGRFFTFFFWLSTLGFALIHLGNYTEGSLAILLPLVLPQFAFGTMLGYLRVHHGLAHAIALHAAHNAILFSLAIAGGLGGEAEGFWRAIY